MKISRFLKKKYIIPGVNLLLIAGIIICLISAANIRSSQLSQQAAERWAGESKEHYTQVSCFPDSGAALTVENIESFAGTVDQKLLEASLEAPENGSLWTYAYSGTATLNISGDYGSAEAEAFGIGGDYFLFHPLQLRSGSYFDDSDLMDDRVVLDEELAWKLFGSTDLAGMTVRINGLPFYVAGVISREDDRFSLQVMAETPRIYLPYSRLQQFQETAISCYEIVLPDPITNFATTLVKDNFPLQNSFQLVENTSRFSAGATAQVLTSFSERTISSRNLAYPYWENAARLAENQLALLLAIGCLLAVFPAVCLIRLIIKELKYVKHKLKKPGKNIR